MLLFDYTANKVKILVLLKFLFFKGRPHTRGPGEGGLVKSGHMRTQGGGGSVAKSGRPQIQILTKILED